MKRHQQGFTLLELMVVVAIIGILAAISIPVYRDFIIRAQVAEGLALTTAAKTGIWEFFQSVGRLPGDNQSIGLPSATSITGAGVSQVALGANGVITVTYRANTAGGGTIVLTPDISNSGSIVWRCSSAIPDNQLPMNCRP